MTKLSEAVERVRELSVGDFLIQPNIADLSLILAALARRPGVPEGWKMVPVEPTRAMIDAAGGDSVNLERADNPGYEPADIYAEMLASAPTPPEAK